MPHILYISSPIAFGLINSGMCTFQANVRGIKRNLNVTVLFICSKLTMLFSQSLTSADFLNHSNHFTTFAKKKTLHWFDVSSTYGYWMSSNDVKVPTEKSVGKHSKMGLYFSVLFLLFLLQVKSFHSIVQIAEE